MTDTPRTTAPAMEGDALTAEQIAAIEERASGATPGPWKRDVHYIVAEVPQGRPGGEVIGSALPSSSHLRGYPREQQIANARFIVSARTDIPALIASHTALRDRLARAEERERELFKALDDVSAQAEKRSLHTFPSKPSQAHSFTRGMRHAIDEVRRLATPTDGAAPPRRSGDGDATGGERE